MQTKAAAQRVLMSSALALLLLWLPASAAVHAGGPSVVDPASQAACYTNETACESAAANVGLCGSGQAAQPCVTGLRSYCAFAGSANTWYCPNAGAPPANVSYSVDLVSGTPCHVSALSCGTLASNTCAAGECENGALSACAFTTSGVFIWYCPHDLGTPADAQPAAEQDTVSGVLCYTTEEACETSPSNTCGSGSNSCLYGATTGCAFTAEDFNWYCPQSTALNQSQLLVAQVDPTSQLTCYTSIASCHLTASTPCTGANGGVPCTNGQANYCAYTGPLFKYFCPLSTGGLPSSVAGALVSIYEIDGVTGVACFRTQTLCESTASTTCGSTNFGYSGVSCAVGSTSVCAYVSDTSTFSYYCPNMLGVAHLNSDVVQIDPVSLLPCYTSAQSCSFAASNLCTYIPKSRLANSSSAAQAAVCVDGSSTVCAFTSGDFTYYCPPPVHRVMPVFAQRDPISDVSCYNTGNPCVGPGASGMMCRDGGMDYCGGNVHFMTSKKGDGGMDYCAFSGNDFTYYCPLSLSLNVTTTTSDEHSTLYQIDAVSSVPCFLSADDCQSTVTNTCGSSTAGNSGVLCTDGYVSVCAFTTYGGYRFYCPNEIGPMALGGGTTLTVQVDPISHAACYRSEQLCRAGAGNPCDAQNTDCVAGPHTACAFASGDGGFMYFCPLALGAAAMQVYRQTDPVSGMACFDTAANCAVAGSNACGTRAQGYSGTLCVSGASSFCAFAGPGFRFYCPLSPLATELGAPYTVDTASGQPCFTSRATCESGSVNTCGTAASGYSGVACTTSASFCAAAAVAAPGAQWFCPNSVVITGTLTPSGSTRRQSSSIGAAALALVWWLVIACA